MVFLRVQARHATTNTLKNKWTGDAWTEEGSSSKTQTKSGLLLGLGYDLSMGKRKAHDLRFSYTHYDNVPDLMDDLDVGDGFLKNNTLDVFRFGYLLPVPIHASALSTSATRYVA